jgi:hypothetical protein
MVLFVQERDLPTAAAGEPSWRTFVGLSGMGLVVLVMLLQVGKRFPSVWGRRRPAEVALTRVPLSRALAPWLVAASVALLAWSALDRRGVELGVADLRVQLPAEHEDEAPDVRSARAELETLRHKVRTGKAALQTYLENRRALADALANRAAPARPSPPAPPTDGAAPGGSQ